MLDCNRGGGKRLKHEAGSSPHRALIEHPHLKTVDLLAKFKTTVHHLVHQELKLLQGRTAVNGTLGDRCG